VPPEPLPKASPALARGLAAKTTRIYADTETELITVVTTRVKSTLKGREPLPFMLAASPRVENDAARIVARLERESAAAVRHALAEAYSRGRRANGPAPHGLLADILDRLHTLATAIRRWVTSLWRRLTGLAIGEADPDRRRRILDQTLQREAARGITIPTPAGRRSVVGLATATVQHRAGLAALDGFMADLIGNGDDLVIVNRTPTACPRCRPWVGKILSVSGGSLEHPSVRHARAAGLWHPNCVHTIFRWYPGFRWPDTATQGDGGTQAAYEQVQRQRVIERHIRDWKRREAAALDDITRMAARRKVRDWQAALRQHLAAHGLQRSRQRERIDYGHTRPLRHAHGR
jgi:hypothetical protein